MTAGPDGNLWFVALKPFSVLDESIGRLTPGGGITEFPLPVRSYEGAAGPAIVAGSDGNLWFTEYGGRKLGRITPGGQITEFPVPGADSRAGAIASGPDGGLWFTDEAASRIGRFKGTITEFALAPGAVPAGIATGPDGNLWFTEKNANKIGRITPAGFVTEFPVPTPGSLPAAITPGPDGNLWFAEEGANQVGRITPVGDVTEFPVPVQTGTEKIVAGPAGDVWFTSETHIGSITPRGRTADPSCLERCRLPIASLAVGPEGNLWFGGDVRITEGGGGTGLAELGRSGLVGRFVPSSPRVTIEPRARSVAGHWTDLRLSCKGAVAGAKCGGVLRLSKLVRSRGSRYAHRVVLTHRRYELFTAESRRIPLRLNARAMKMLTRGDSLSVRATAMAHGRVEATRSVELHGQRRRHPAKAASAEYRTLSVGSYTPGGGTVAASPAGLTCEVGGFSCRGQFPLGSLVTVTAPPNKGFAFSGFSRDCSGPVCALIMDADKKVDVDFIRFAALGQAKRDEKAGSAVLAVRVGGPGTLVASGRRIERQERILATDANVKLPIVARGSAAKKLLEHGLAKVDVRISFTPAAGTRARFSRPLWLRRETPLPGS
jgi:virginiamycin B lyase